MLDHKYSDYGKFIGSTFKPALQWDNHFSSSFYESVPRDDSDILIVPEIRFGCISPPYQKLFWCICRSCSVYSFFSDVSTRKPPCGINLCVKIHTVVLEAVGISSALNTPNPLWSRSWKFPNIASEWRLDINRWPQVPLSADAYRRSTLLLCPWA